MFRSRKAQSSIEFLTIVGIALLVSSPFILSAQRSVVNVQQNSELITLQNSLDKLDSAVQMVSTAGEPAKMNFLMRIPDSVTAAMVAQDRAVVYTVRTQGGMTNVSRIFDTNISAPGGLPNRTRQISVEAWNDQVNITVIK